MKKDYSNNLNSKRQSAAKLLTVIIHITEMGMIYIIHLPNGKKYIGQHCNNNLYERKQTHKHQFNYFCKKKETEKNTRSEFQNPKGFCSALYNAFLKYNFKKCIFTALEYDIPLDKINDVEDSYILELNTLHPNGYNLKLNSSEYKVFSEETLKKMSESQSKVRITSLRNYRKYPEQLEGLPQHVIFHNSKKKRGYSIINHPKCKSKSFTSSRLSIDELKLETIEFLEELEGKSIEEILYAEEQLKIQYESEKKSTSETSGSKKAKRDLPRGVKYYKNGYKAMFILNKKNYSKSFIDTSLSNEENLRLAVEWYKNTDIEDVKRERDLPSGISYYKDGYRARVRYGTKAFCEYFRNNSVSKEKNIELAVIWLNNKKAEIKKLKNLKEEGSETK